MAEQDEVLSRETAIAAKLEENGITLRAKSRGVAAFDRLVGSLFDIPAAFLEGATRKRRLRDEIYERLKNAQAQIAEQQIQELPGLGRELIYDVLKDRARKQANAAGVAIEAMDAMKALPPPGPLPAGETTTASSDDIDEDWLNQFTRFAEDASSERLQQVWGRILAGEIVKPGSFSRHTLRFVAELDKETAENCEFVKQRVVDSWLLKGEEWNEGREYLISVELQRLGVIEGVGAGSPQRNYVLDANGTIGIVATSWALFIRGTPGTKLSFPVFILTRMGQEVMSLLSVGDETQALSKVADQLNKSGLESIELSRFLRHSDNQAHFSSLQPLWQVSGQPPGAA